MFDLMEQGDFVLGAWDGWWHDTELPFTSIYASDLFFCFVSRMDMSVYDGFSFHRVLCIHDQNTCIVTPTFENELRYINI